MIEIIITAIIVIVMGGMCFDWIFSGSINPIYANNDGSEQEAISITPTYRRQPSKEGVIRLTCPKCRFNTEYDTGLVETQVSVICKRCKHLFEHKHIAEA